MSNMKDEVNMSRLNKSKNNNSINNPKQKSKITLHLQDKIDIIEEVEKRVPYRFIKEKYGITNSSTISMIMTRKEKYIQAYNNNANINSQNHQYLKIKKQPSSQTNTNFTYVTNDFIGDDDENEDDYFESYEAADMNDTDMDSNAAAAARINESSLIEQQNNFFHYEGFKNTQISIFNSWAD